MKTNTADSLHLSIIIVSYNTRELTLQTIKTAAESCNASYNLRDNAEIIVVDNNSKDDTARAVQEFAKTSSVRVKLIGNIDNKGFGQANNQGAEIARGKFLLFLNPDTIVPADTLGEFISIAEQTTADSFGIWGCALANDDGSSQAQGGDLPSLVRLTTQYLGLDDLPIIGKYLPSIQHTGKRAQKSQDTIEEKGWVGGTAMLVDTELIEKIGSFDPDIFMYGEDVELCARAAWQGFKSAIVHVAHPIIHLQNQSSTSTNALIGEFKGNLYFFGKYKAAWQKKLARYIMQTGFFLRIIAFTILQKKDNANQYREVLEKVRLN